MRTMSLALGLMLLGLVGAPVVDAGCYNDISCATTPPASAPTSCNAQILSLTQGLAYCLSALPASADGIVYYASPATHTTDDPTNYPYYFGSCLDRGTSGGCQLAHFSDARREAPSWNRTQHTASVASGNQCVWSVAYCGIGSWTCPYCGFFNYAVQLDLRQPSNSSYACPGAPCPTGVGTNAASLNSQTEDYHVRAYYFGAGGPADKANLSAGSSEMVIAWNEPYNQEQLRPASDSDGCTIGACYWGNFECLALDERHVLLTWNVSLPNATYSLYAGSGSFMPDPFEGSRDYDLSMGDLAPGGSAAGDMRFVFRATRASGVSKFIPASADNFTTLTTPDGTTDQPYITGAYIDTTPSQAPLLTYTLGYRVGTYPPDGTPTLDDLYATYLWQERGYTSHTPILAPAGHEQGVPHPSGDTDAGWEAPTASASCPGITSHLFGEHGTVYGDRGAAGLAADLGVAPLAAKFLWGAIFTLAMGVLVASSAEDMTSGVRRGVIGMLLGLAISFAVGFYPWWLLLFGLIIAAAAFLYRRQGGE